MIVIDDKILSDDIVREQFVCDLAKCKGGCCEEGDAGAPLTKEELGFVEEYYEIVKPYLPADAIAHMEKHGKYHYDEEFGWVTPILPSDNEICTFAYREPGGLIKCAFEQAYNEGKISWKKPISCHLYPIIAYKGKHGDYERLNYEPRRILCSPACKLGSELKVPVYKFLREPLERKYGKAFYEALDHIAQHHNVDTGEE
ncbi:MAG: DUF3109 family protein [Niabella sp.]